MDSGQSGGCSRLEKQTELSLICCKACDSLGLTMVSRQREKLDSQGQTRGKASACSQNKPAKDMSFNSLFLSFGAFQAGYPRQRTGAAQQASSGNCWLEEDVRASRTEHNPFPLRIKAPQSGPVKSTGFPLWSSSKMAPRPTGHEKPQNRTIFRATIFESNRSRLFFAFAGQK